MKRVDLVPYPPAVRGADPLPSSWQVLEGGRDGEGGVRREVSLTLVTSRDLGRSPIATPSAWEWKAPGPARAPRSGGDL